MNQKISLVSTAPSFKASTLKADDVIDTVITLPPDGGWGWLVVAAAFFSNFIADGANYTFGIFLNEISQSFNVAPTTVAIGNSLMTGFYLTSGPITCAMVNRWGFQVTGFLGGAVAGIAFLLSAIQTSTVGFLIMFGVVGGFGFGMVYVPSIVVIGFYFERWRALATSIAVTGSSIGIIGFPYIIKGLLKSYHWRTNFKVIAAGCLLTSFLALIYRPLKPVRIAVRDKRATEFFSDNPEIVSTVSIQSARKQGFFKRLFHRFHNVTYPTAAQVHKDSTLIISVANTASSSSTFLNDNSLDGSVSTFFKTTASKMDTTSKVDRLSTVYEIDPSRSTFLRRCCRKCHCCKKCFHWGDRNRPMYRDDIFFTGSVYTLPGYTQSRNISQSSRAGKQKQSIPQLGQKSMEYHMSVTRVSVREKDGEKVHCQCCPESVVRTLVTMLNFSLLKSPSFFILAASGFFTLLGMYVPFVYLIERARECGISEKKSIHLYTALGASNAVGRVVTGVISTIPQAKPLMISYTSLVICGVATIISYFLREVVAQFVYTSVFGLTIACMSSLRAPIIVEMVGLEALTNAFGLILLFQGVAGFTGVPLAGQIVVLTKTYNAAFIFSGCVITFSGIMLIPLKQISQWEQTKVEKI